MKCFGFSSDPINMILYVTDGGAPGTSAWAAFPQLYGSDAETQRSHGNIGTCCKTHSTRLNCSCHRQLSSLHHQPNDLTKGSQQTPRAGFIKFLAARGSHCHTPTGRAHCPGLAAVRGNSHSPGLWSWRSCPSTDGDRQLPAARSQPSFAPS